jgi:hypothetical protein
VMIVIMCFNMGTYCENYLTYLGVRLTQQIRFRGCPR